MRFQLIDAVLDRCEDRIRAVKQVSLAEEYLGDHFPGFPVLPGVMMIETLAQAARRLLDDRGGERLVLGEVRALKFGSMVRPGEALEVEVTLEPARDGDSDAFRCRGNGVVRRRDGNGAERVETAVTGRFTMRPIRRSPGTTQGATGATGTSGD